jgi:hypothetical protein
VRHLFIFYFENNKGRKLTFRMVRFHEGICGKTLIKRKHLLYLNLYARHTHQIYAAATTTNGARAQSGHWQLLPVFNNVLYTRD